MIEKEEKIEESTANFNSYCDQSSQLLLIDDRKLVKLTLITKQKRLYTYIVSNAKDNHDHTFFNSQLN